MTLNSSDFSRVAPDAFSLAPARAKKAASCLSIPIKERQRLAFVPVAAANHAGLKWGVMRLF